MDYAHSADAITGQRRFARLLWAIPLSILVHNLEEYPRIVAYARRHGVPIRRRPMGIAVALATVLPLPVTAAAARRISSRGRLQLALAIPAVMAANGAMHLGQTVVLRDYSPGTATGVAINIPLAIALYRRAARERRLAPGELRRAALLGAAAMAPLALLLQALGWLLDRGLPGGGDEIESRGPYALHQH